MAEYQTQKTQLPVGGRNPQSAMPSDGINPSPAFYMHHDAGVASAAGPVASSDMPR